MLGHENVSAIINEIIAKLNSRLEKHPHKILTEAHFNASFSNSPHCLRCNDGNYIAFTSESKWHNTDLTLNRMRNVYNIRQLLNQQLTDVLKDGEEQLYHRVEKIYKLLELGKAINAQISNEFGVSHVTYQEGRLAGHNMFSSRLNASWTGSRTQRLFEKSMSLLNEFKQKYGIITPAPSAPPEYSASLETPMAHPVSAISARKV